MDLVIAVGGSGQHVALELSRLVYLGAMPKMELVVVDSDTDSKLAHQLQTMEGHVDSSRGLEHPLQGGSASFRSPYNQADAKKDAKGELSFQHLMVRDQLDDDIGEAFTALFSPEDAARDVQRGFYAMPVLGGTTFGAQGKDVIDKLREGASAANRAVYVVGSFVGGTGAGVIPAIVEQLASSGTWHGSFLLDWLQAAGGGSSSISQENMVTNSRHALQYFYDHLRPNLRATALVGPAMAEGGALLAAAAPDPSQGETTAIFPLLACFALVPYFDRSKKFNSSVFVYGHEPTKARGLLEEQWRLPDRQTLQTRLWTARRAALALDYYTGTTDEAKKNRANMASAFGVMASKDQIPAGLAKWINNFCDQAGLVTSRLGIKTRRQEDLVRMLLVELEHRAKTLNNLVIHFDKVFAPAGGIGQDVKADEVRRDPHSAIWNAWSSGEITPPNKGQGPESHVLYAQYLADELVKLVLAVV